MNENDITIFNNKIKDAATIGIFGHIRPDGDCVGSCLGLYNYLLDNYPEKKVVVYLRDVPESFGFLRGFDQIRTNPDDEKYDLGISLDCGDTDRHGDFGYIYKASKDSICLDHHISNQGFGNYFYCDSEASSTSELLYRYLELDKISLDTANCLYLGIIHDTGVFRYPATTKETMICAGELMSKGINTQFIIDSTFYKVNYIQNRLTGQALLNAKLYFDGKVIATCITKEMFDAFGATKKDTEGIVDKIRVTDGVEVAVFVYQLDDDRFKFSLRSISKVDVSVIAVNFGGGGHVRAAGFEVTGKYEDNFAKILEMIKEQL